MFCQHKLGLIGRGCAKCGSVILASMWVQMAFYEMGLGRDWVMVVSLAAASASSFPGTSECPGTRWIVMEVRGVDAGA